MCRKLLPHVLEILGFVFEVEDQRELDFPQLDSPGELQFLGMRLARILISFIAACMCMIKTEKVAVAAERLHERRVHCE